jgi:hypothetical protein
MNKGFEKLRACDRHEIQQLKTSLDEMHKHSLGSRELAIQHAELVKQLQAKMNLTENTTVDMAVFQVLAQGQTQCSTLQQRTNKTLTTGPFGNTCEVDEVSPEVEAEVVAGLRCLQP